MNLRTIRRLGLAALWCLAVAPAATGADGLRYTISVTKFENRAQEAAQYDLGDAWGAVMTDRLQNSGRFIVLGENDMRVEAIAEQDFAAGPRAAQGARTPVTGQMTAAQLLLKGVITHVEHRASGGGAGLRIKRWQVGGKKDRVEINATIYVVDATTGQLLGSTSVVGAHRGNLVLGRVSRAVGGRLLSFPAHAGRRADPSPHGSYLGSSPRDSTFAISRNAPGTP